jgi:hypothetical protein
MVTALTPMAPAGAERPTAAACVAASLPAAATPARALGSAAALPVPLSRGAPPV